MLFRDEAPILDAVKTKVDDLAQVATAGEYVNFNGVHANLGLQVLAIPISATAVSQPIATFPYPVTFVGAVVRFETASSSGTLQIELTPSGTAAGSGTNLLTGTISLAGTAATNTYGAVTALAGGADCTPGITVPVGDSISIVIGGTMTSLAGCQLTIFYTRAAV